MRDEKNSKVQKVLRHLHFSLFPLNLLLPFFILHNSSFTIHPSSFSFLLSSLALCAPLGS